MKSNPNHKFKCNDCKQIYHLEQIEEIVDENNEFICICENCIYWRRKDV